MSRSQLMCTCTILQVYLVEELLSPIITPFILCFCLRKKALEIVDFFRNFTVEVVGVGDVCSFAQMDIRKHGNPQVRMHGICMCNHLSDMLTVMYLESVCFPVHYPFAIAYLFIYCKFCILKIFSETTRFIWIYLWMDDPRKCISNFYCKIV